MKKLLSALIAGTFAAVTFAAVAADDSKVPYTAQPPIQKPGRAADSDKPFTAQPPGTKPGRAADEGKPADTTKKSSSSSKKSHSKKKSTTTPPADQPAK